MASGYRRLLAEPRVTVLNNSTAGAADYRVWLGRPDANIRVLRNGLDLDAFRRIDVPAARARLRSRLGLAPDALVVGTVNRLYEEKRPLLWIQAAAALAQVHASSQFVFVGDGILAGDARDLAASLGIASRVHFVGHQSDAPHWTAGFDVFMLTSRKEGLPNVLIEAQALGVPVVTTAAGGAAETLVPGLTGWVVDSGDPIALAERLATVLDDDAWRAQARAEAPAFVAARFSIDRMLAETLGVYGVDVAQGVPA
jgi:glycosyltransferase involved in cell wall biosynthesis